jgi:hypothetical protein
MVKMSQAWWQILIIPTLRMLRLKNHEFEANLGYIKRSFLHNNKT